MIEHPKDAWETFLEEFIDIFSIEDLAKYKIFICGSYRAGSLENLLEIKHIIPKQSTIHLTFFESDFRETYQENLILKFDLIADMCDEIIMIIEHDTGGHMIEMGMIIASEEYRNKTYVYVARDAQVTQMLKGGVLVEPFFTEDKNLFYFDDIEDLKSQILDRLGIVEPK